MLQHIVFDLGVGCPILKFGHIHIFQRELNPNLFRVDLTLGKQDNRLAMLRPRKQIDRLHLFRMISLFFQPLRVPRGGGGVAADVDDPAGGHLDDGGEGGLVAALAGRVKDDDVRVEALGSQLGRGFARIGAEEAAFGGNRAAHAGGVGLGALNGFGDDLHADELAAAVCH